MKTGINPSILIEEIQKYINANLTADLHSLLLKRSPFAEVSMHEIAQQIKGKKVAQKKFPFLLRDGIVFPPNLNLEQASSQSTAEYKAKNLKGKSFLDLTSGFGIDAYFLSQNFDQVTLVEQNTELLETVKHNWNILGRKANFINENLEDFLEENSQKFDFIYLDPARRDAEKNKKFLLEDLSPNLLEIQEKLGIISDEIIVKLSPLIDISYLLSVVKNVSKIEIIAVKNEVKELLVFISGKNSYPETQIKCVNLESTDPDFVFIFNDEKNAVAEYSDPQNFLYLPNNAVLKSGAFNTVAKKFKLLKLHANTHFYTSDELVKEFPGRLLEVVVIEPKHILKGEKFNIISKNYPLSPDEIKKKYKISDGGKTYLIFTQSQNGKIILKSV
ncbi:MAG: RsmD family RNA methyltransferase [Kaistella sp.]|nr:RsmD family RNA methyltransferase [Kaistella sp.]